MNKNNEPLFTTPDDIVKENARQDNCSSRASKTSSTIGIGPVTTNFFRSLLNKMNNEQKHTLTQNLIDPIMSIINLKMRPYIYISIGMYLLIVLLLIYLIWTIKRNKI